MAIARQTALALRLLTIGRLAGQLVSWGATLFVIRLLDARDYGLMALALMFIATTALFSELGIGQALVQRRELDIATRRRALGLLLTISALASTLLVLIAGPAARWFETPELQLILIVLAGQFPIIALGTLPDVMLRRAMQFGRKATAEFVAMLGGSLGTLWLAWQGYGVWALVFGNLLMVTLRSAGFMLASPQWLRPDWTWRGHTPLLRFGGALTVGHLLWLIYTQADVLLISKTLGATSLGIYAIAMQIASLPMQKLASIINDVGFAALSRLASQPDVFRRQFLRAIEVTCLLSFPVFFGLAAVADGFVRLVLGDKWLAVIPLLMLLSLSLPLRMLSTLLPTALHALDQTGLSLRIRALTALLMLLAFAGGLQWGLLGIAWAWALMFPCCLLLSLWLALPALGLRTRQVCQQCWPAALMAALMFGLLQGLQHGPWPWPGDAGLLLQSLDFALRCLLGAAVYLAGVVMLRPHLPQQMLQLLRAR